jgi:hypothetical protein
MERISWRRQDSNTAQLQSFTSGLVAHLDSRDHSRATFVYHRFMRHTFRFLWNATRRHHLAPWRSPYLLWRIETYCGVKMTQIGFLEFWEFLWRERSNLWRFLKWTSEMDRYAHPKPKNP